MRISDWSSDVCSSELLGEMSRNFRLRITPALSLDGQLEPLDPLPGVASGWSRGETRSRISPCSPAASAEIANRLGNPTVAAAPPASKDSRKAGAVMSLKEQQYAGRRYPGQSSPR